MRQDRADIRLGLSILGESVAGVIVVLVVFLHGQLFTVPAPRRRTTAVGQGYQFAAYCLHWATHMHGHNVMEVVMIFGFLNQIFVLFGQIHIAALKTHTNTVSYS